MKRIIKMLFVCSLVILASGHTIKAEKVVKNEPIPYKEVGVHDPSIIKDGDMYYIFGSHGSAAKSQDLMSWDYFVDNSISNHTLLGDIRTNLAGAFAWAGNKTSKEVGGMGIWAPDVFYNESYINEDGTVGAFLMYFSLSTGQDDGVNEHYRSLIGLAAATSIEGPYIYKDTVIYSGFKNEEGLSHHSRTDFSSRFPHDAPRENYFKANGSYDFDRYPNAIDPTIVKTHDDLLYMIYGSWNAGIWALELDPMTGLPLTKTDYSHDSTITNVDPYFGNQLSGGFWASGEGPYIRYHEPSGYYHLYVTYGGLLQNDTYNIRVFRSQSITGPYEDINGKSAIFKSHRDNAKVGNRLLGSFEFLKEHSVNEDATFYGYRVPGHNSVLYDDDGNDYLITHTRFKDKGEGHQVRVHSLAFTSEGWPLVSASRHHINDEKVSDQSLVGSYAIVMQGQDNSKLTKTSVGLTFEKDGTLGGSYEGSWEFDGEVLSVMLGKSIYKGVVLNQASPLTAGQPSLTFSLMGDNGGIKGHSILGIQISKAGSKELLGAAHENLSLARTNGILANLKLPTDTYGGIKIAWQSSNKDVISNKGIVSRQEQPIKLKLEATLSLGDQVKKKTFNVDVVGVDGTQLSNNKEKFVIFTLIGVCSILCGVFVNRRRLKMYVHHPKEN